MRRLENTQIRFLHFAEERQNTLKGLKIDWAHRNANKPTHKCSVLLCVRVAVCSQSLCVCVWYVKVTVKQNKGSACGGSEGDRWFVAWEPGSLSWDEQYLRSLHV